MSLRTVLKRIEDGLWLLGGISAAADLGLEDFGPGADGHCPREDEHPCCSTLEAPACPPTCLNCSPAPQSRCS